MRSGRKPSENNFEWMVLAAKFQKYSGIWRNIGVIKMGNWDDSGVIEVAQAIFPLRYGYQTSHYIHMLKFN